MSVATMSNLAKNDAEKPANALSLFSGYIPSEALAVYIGALGILTPTSDATVDQIWRVRLICFAGGLAVAIFISFLNLSFKPEEEVPRREVFRRRVVVAFLAGLAFIFYAAATPSFFYENAFLTIHFTEWAAFGAVLCAVFLPQTAKWLGAREMTEKPKPDPKPVQL